MKIPSVKFYIMFYIMLILGLPIIIGAVYNTFDEIYMPDMRTAVDQYKLNPTEDRAQEIGNEWINTLNNHSRNDHLVGQVYGINSNQMTYVKEVQQLLYENGHYKIFNLLIDFVEPNDFIKKELAKKNTEITVENLYYAALGHLLNNDKDRFKATISRANDIDEDYIKLKMSYLERDGKI